MEDFIMNPWTITITGGIVVALITKFLIKKEKKQKNYIENKDVSGGIGIQLNGNMAGLNFNNVHINTGQKINHDLKRKFSAKYPVGKINITFKLIRNNNHADIYLIDLNNMTKYKIKDMKNFDLIGFSTADVEKINDKEFELYKRGEEINFY